MSWQPTDDQINFHLSPAIDLIQEDLDDLKAAGFPASYLAEFLECNFVEKLKAEGGAA